MKFATVRDLKNRTSELLRRAAGGTHVLITSHGRPVAMLTGMNEEDLEDWVWAHDPELRASIEEAERDFRAGRGIPLEQVIRELKLKIGGGRRTGGGRKRTQALSPRPRRLGFPVSRSRPPHLEQDA